MLKEKDHWMAQAYSKLENCDPEIWYHLAHVAVQGVGGKVVNGKGGVHRYYIREHGIVEFSARHASLSNTLKAQEMGLRVEWPARHARYDWRECVRYHWEVSDEVAQTLDLAAEVVPFHRDILCRDTCADSMAAWLSKIRPLLTDKESDDVNFEIYVKAWNAGGECCKACDGD